jgi:hypothetical protein
MTPHETELALHASRWKKCDVNNLAASFHCFDGNSQHERISTLHLTRRDLKSLFPKDEQVTAFQLTFGLNEETTHGYPVAFRVMIKVSHFSGLVTGKPFRWGLPADLAASSKVPFEFKEWLHKNWMELDMSQVDDVFTASLPPDPPQSVISDVPAKRITQRLLCYPFAGNKNDIFFGFIKDNISRIQNLIFHMGVDMNKYNHKEKFSFSPIMEAQFKKPSPEDLTKIYRSGLRCIPTGNDDEDSAFYEYMKPCPPTC